MEQLVIDGGRRLNGELTVQGAKNSVLPILAATVISRGVSVLHNCPRLSDLDAAISILSYLGCKVHWEGHTVVVDATDVNRSDIPDSLMREMRSSITFLGSVAARMGRAELSAPGGCEIGVRPIDLHLAAMKQFGMEIQEEHGRLCCECPQGMTGAKIALSFPSVGATENIMLAASTAHGQTTILNAAREPEISDLADYLNGCGARIHGAGEGTIVIDGVEKLTGTEHTVIPDRIEVATFMAAAAVTHGNIRLKGIIPAHVGTIIPVFQQAGCEVNVRCRELSIVAPPRLKALKTVRTMPYPGFPTDAQAPMMTVAALAEGTSVFVETIFESRFKHVAELVRLGGRIQVTDRVAVVEGVPTLSGAPVLAGDLRGGAALVVAGLGAQGVTTVSNVQFIDRGYENIEESLKQLGAQIKREVTYEQTDEGQTARKII